MPDKKTDIIEWQDLGLTPYTGAWELQEGLRIRRVAGEISDRLITLEHPPVFTMGRRDCAEDFCSSEEEIRKDGIEIIKSNRGGRVTYHGPGQLVGYFIFHLDEAGVGIKDFVSLIEEICISTLEHFGIHSSRDENHPGLWICRNKIVAIGLNVQHGVTAHGFALNVDCDLKAYRHIVACGISDRGIAKMSEHTKTPPEMGCVKAELIKNVERIFSRKVRKI